MTKRLRLSGQIFSMFVPDQLPDVYDLQLHIIQCDESVTSKTCKSIWSKEYKKTEQFPISYSIDYQVEDNSDSKYYFQVTIEKNNQILFYNDERNDFLNKYKNQFRKDINIYLDQPRN